MPLDPTSARDPVAYQLLQKKYDDATADQKSVIDHAITSARTHVEQISQWYTLDTAANAPSVWQPWLIARAARIAALTIRPDRYQHFHDIEAESEQAAVDAYLRTSWGSGVQFTIPDPESLRKYVASYCARMYETPAIGGNPNRPRLWIDPAVTDAAAATVFIRTWNMADWLFKRRQAVMRISVVSFSGASWNESTRTLTSTGAFGTVVPGSIVRVRSGTNTITGDYVAESATSNTVVLRSSLQSSGGAASGVGGSVSVVTFQGLSSGEEYDSDGTSAWTYTDGGGSIRWVGADVMAAARAQEEITDSGRPRMYRVSEDTRERAWWLYPFPDGSYQATGEVGVVGPGSKNTPITSTSYLRFPAEFWPFLFRATLAEVLIGLGHARGQALKAEADREAERLLPIYAHPGGGTLGSAVRDVYGDIPALSRLGVDMYLGGGL